MSAPSLGARVNAVLVRMMLYQEGGAVAYDGDRITHGRGGHGKHGTTTAAPPDTRALVVEWAERFERLLAAAERDAERFERNPGSTAHAQDRGGELARERRRRVLSRANEGRDPTFVAFIEGMTSEAVRKMRGRAGLDPDDGTRRPRPLTDTTPRG